MLSLDGDQRYDAIYTRRKGSIAYVRFVGMELYSARLRRERNARIAKLRRFVIAALITGGLVAAVEQIIKWVK
jgi:hypothetical protein